MPAMPIRRVSRKSAHSSTSPGGWGSMSMARSPVTPEGDEALMSAPNRGDGDMVHNPTPPTGMRPDIGPGGVMGGPSSIAAIMARSRMAPGPGAGSIAGAMRTIPRNTGVVGPGSPMAPNPPMMDVNPFLRKSMGPEQSGSDRLGMLDRMRRGGFTGGRGMF
jgi:hypothetical protein